MTLLDMQGMSRADACGFGCGCDDGCGGGFVFGFIGFFHESCISICFCPEFF